MFVCFYYRINDKEQCSKKYCKHLEFKEFSVRDWNRVCCDLVASPSYAICYERSYKRSYCARDLREESKDQSSKDDNDAWHSFQPRPSRTDRRNWCTRCDLNREYVRTSSDPVPLSLHLHRLIVASIGRQGRILFGQGQGRWLALLAEVRLQFLARGCARIAKTAFGERFT